MAGVFYLNLEGTKQGKIKGSSTKQQGGVAASDVILCIGLKYSDIKPLGSQLGTTTGKRSHRSITITREVDTASPKLFQALVVNEVFKAATIQFPNTGSDGKPSTVRKIELTNGSIIDIRQAPSNAGKKCENVTLTYEDLLVNGTPHGVIPHFS